MITWYDWSQQVNDSLRVPMKIEAARFSVTNALQNEAKLTSSKLNRQRVAGYCGSQASLPGIDCRPSKPETGVCVLQD